MTLIIALPLVFDRVFFVYQLFSFFSLYRKLSINLIVACTAGHYGDNCTKTCGNCLDDKTCNNVNGTCTDGCKEGFKGGLCITSMFKTEPQFNDTYVSNLND